MAEHTIPETLIERIRAGRAALVLGSSIGTLAGMPSWKKLLDKMREAVEQRGKEGDAQAAEDVAGLLKKGRLISACGFLARDLGGEACDAIIAEAWKSPDILPDAAKVLGRVPIRAIWTTHPGDFVERAVQSGSPDLWPAPRVGTYENAGELEPRKRHILKLLGDLAKGSYVVIPTSVRRALANAQAFRERLQDLYNDGALIFVGFRVGDPDLQAVLDKVLGSFEVPKVEHYFVAAGLGPVNTEELEAEHHMKVIPLEGQKGDDKAIESLVEFLGNLADACEKAGVTLAVTRPADDDLEGWMERYHADPQDAEALDALGKIEKQAREVGVSDRLVEVLMGRAEGEADSSARARLLREVARIFEEQIGDLPRAFTALTAALRENPADEEVITAAARLAEETDGYGELVADLSELVPQIQDKKVAAAHLVRLGKWYAEKLHHDDYAIASFREALKRDGGLRHAREGLEEIYRKQQKWGELAQELVAHAEVETDSARRVDIFLSLADLYETQLASTAKAMEAYEKVAEADHDNDDALAALERLYRRGERWGKLATVLERRAEKLATSDPQRAVAMRKELASLRSEKLGDVEGAIARYEAAVALNERDLDALKSLEKLYEKVGRTDDYLRILERLAEVGPEGERAAMWRRLAAEVEDRDGGAARAMKYYENVLAIEPSARDAFRTLERLYRKEEAWEEVVKLNERHMAVMTTPAERLDMWVAMGNLYEQQLHDPHRAIEAYVNVLDLQGDNKDTLAALSRLYKRVEQWDRAVATIEKLASLSGVRGADLWFEAGQIANKELKDPTTAEQRFSKALEIDLAHVPSLMALIDLAKKRKDWARAAQLMLEAERQTQNRMEKISLFFDAARIHQTELDQPDKAADLYARVLTLDPEHVDAGLNAVEYWVHKEDWEQAEPVLEMLARKVEADDRVEKGRREGLLGRASEALGHSEKAQKHYRLAVEADPESLDAAQGLANLLYLREHWAEAEKQYREVLARHRPSLAEGQLIEIWHRIGVAAKGRGDMKAAEGALRRALEHDPRHQQSLLLIIELAEKKGDWKGVIEAKRHAMEGTNEEERYKALDEIGDIFAQKLDDPVTAMGTYLEALKIKPRSHQVLHKTLEIYTEQKQWRQALATLQRLAEIEKDAALRSKYEYAAAVIARDELNDPDEAVEYFTRALDDAPTMPKAFEAIEKLLGDRSDWKGLVRAYRKMIKRVADRAGEAQLLQLWQRLGDVALEKVGDTEAAMAAFEVAATLEPGNMQRHEQLARLYLEAGADRAEKASHELQVLLKRSPDRLDLYQNLSRLYVEMAQEDKAYCLAQALVFLGQASDEEKARAESHKPKHFSMAKRRLTEELWQKAIIHPKEDRVLNGIFSSLMTSLAATTAQPHQALMLNPKEQTDPEKDPHLVARMFRYAVQTLGITPAPELYLRPGTKDGIRAANVADKGVITPAVLIGDPYVNKKAEREVAFDVAKKLAFFRPERYVYYALPTLPKLEHAFEASLVATGVANGKRETEVEKLAHYLKKAVPATVMEHVTVLAKKLPSAAAATGGAHQAVNGWVTATDLTANRVGLILSNDLETAAKMIATEQGVQSTLTAKERLRELLAYSVSEEYFTVRRHLGLDVAAAAAAQRSAGE